jgi:hypothetical protein
MSDQAECEIELNLDGGFIDRDGLDGYIELYLKYVLIHGSVYSTWAYLDIRTEEEFSVHIVGMKFKSQSSLNMLELNIDLTSEFLPYREKILEAKKNNVNICGPTMKGTCCYSESGTYVGDLELIVEEIGAKVVIGEDSDIEKYYHGQIESEVQSDSERRYDPDRRYEHYHYF